MTDLKPELILGMTFALRLAVILSPTLESTLADRLAVLLSPTLESILVVRLVVSLGPTLGLVLAGSLVATLAPLSVDQVAASTPGLFGYTALADISAWGRSSPQLPGRDVWRRVPRHSDG